MNRKFLNISMIAIVCIIVSLFVLENNIRAAGGDELYLSTTQETYEEVTMENSRCANLILEFSGADSIWDVTFIFQPEELCVVKKDDTWYDLYNENKIIMKQKLLEDKND